MTGSTVSPTNKPWTRNFSDSMIDPVLKTLIIIDIHGLVRVFLTRWNLECIWRMSKEIFKGGRILSHIVNEKWIILQS